MYDIIRCGLLSGSLTLFASIPSSFEMSLEKIGFGALLFFIIWTYMKHILPKTYEEMRSLREENRKLLEEVAKLKEQAAFVDIQRAGGVSPPTAA